MRFALKLCIFFNFCVYRTNNCAVMGTLFIRLESGFQLSVESNQAITLVLVCYGLRLAE